MAQKRSHIIDNICLQIKCTRKIPGKKEFDKRELLYLASYIAITQSVLEKSEAENKAREEKKAGKKRGQKNPNVP